MIRFVDLRGHDTGHRFAFYDTVVDQFVTQNGVQAWDVFDEFAQDFERGDLDRFKRLCPTWALTQPALDIEEATIKLSSTLTIRRATDQEIRRAGAGDPDIVMKMRLIGFDWWIDA